jgi:thiamine biosynthesis lipoprotein
MQLYSFPFAAMGSQCEIRLTASTPALAQQFAQLAIQEVRRIEYKYSRYRQDSLLSQINQAAGQKVIEIDTETLELITYADTLYQVSAGLFDISSGVLRHAWDFKRAQLPKPELIERCLAQLGWNKVQFDEKQIYLSQTGMEIDLGGIAKEYAVDRVAKLLEEQGCIHALVNLGGDIRVLGTQLNGQTWVIGIQHPRQVNTNCASISIGKGALATSGDYERFFEIDGVRYCHLLNPKTGWPVCYWQSMSILAPLTLAAGSIASIAMLMEEQGTTWLQQQHVAYFAIDQKGRHLIQGAPLINL